MKILAIDPGLAALGIASVYRDGKGGPAQVTGAVTIKTDSNAPLMDRLALLGREVALAVYDAEPDEIRIEKLPRYVRDAPTIIETAQAVGVVIQACLDWARRYNTECVIGLFEPYRLPMRLSRKHGRGAKDNMIRMLVTQRLDIEPPKSQHECDALEIASRS